MSSYVRVYVVVTPKVIKQIYVPDLISSPLSVNVLIMPFSSCKNNSAMIVNSFKLYYKVIRRQ